MWAIHIFWTIFMCFRVPHIGFGLWTSLIVYSGVSCLVPWAAGGQKKKKRQTGWINKVSGDSLQLSPVQTPISKHDWWKILRTSFSFLMYSDFTILLFLFAAMPSDTLYWHTPICLFTLCFRKKVNSEDGCWHINMPQYSDNIPPTEIT